MTPNIEEALRSLRAADRDSKAFEILKDAAGAPLTAVCFHAQQAVEKSLKAVLFLHRIEFRRTHDLVKLAELLRNQGIDPPVPDGALRRLNPFAVTFRYDDTDIARITREEAAEIVTATRDWAAKQMKRARPSSIP